ncbi:MAG: hypothetical protein KKB21_01905 [Nanoarchaeota archaeon]|nr:hypothetical protein [Nanoarchaeota archaeon]MBU4086308.1 hypothetical protein [Nanoarchaeota archaeon]
MRRLSSKTGAIELSIGTIVIIVIALTMLILGIVLVRSIMCGAIRLTSDTSDAAQNEVNKLFEATGGEINCIGGSGDAVVMMPGQVNIVTCGIRSTDSNSKYKIEVTGIAVADKNVLSSSEVNKWKSGPDYFGPSPVSPDDETVKKILRLNVPKDAPETGIFVDVRATKEGRVIYTQTLDFRISRQGLIRATMC